MLYKYFADIEAVLIAWHERHVARHLDHLKRLGQRSGDPAARLKTVLEAYAMISYHGEHLGAELAAALHRGSAVRSPRCRSVCSTLSAACSRVIAVRLLAKDHRSGVGAFQRLCG